MKNSFKLLTKNKTSLITPEEDYPMSGSKLDVLKRQLQSESELHSKSQTQPKHQN